MMNIVPRRDGCLVIQSEGDDSDEIVVEPTLEQIIPTANNFRCGCGAVLGTRELADGAEIECPKCFTVHARFALGLRWSR